MSVLAVALVVVLIAFGTGWCVGWKDGRKSMEPEERKLRVVRGEHDDAA